MCGSRGKHFCLLPLSLKHFSVNFPYMHGPSPLCFWHVTANRLKMWVSSNMLKTVCFFFMLLFHAVTVCGKHSVGLVSKLRPPVCRLCKKAHQAFLLLCSRYDQSAVCRRQTQRERSAWHRKGHPAASGQRTSHCGGTGVCSASPEM